MCGVRQPVQVDRMVSYPLVFIYLRQEPSLGMVLCVGSGSLFRSC